MFDGGSIISVIVPIYNVEIFLPRCINSIINQTYRHLEILLIDDGSLDKSGQICDDYAKNDSRIRVIHKSNGGLSDARNKGLRLSKGELLSFLDSDDWIALDYFEVLLRNMIETNADISACNFLRLDDEKDVLKNTNEKLRVFTNIEALDQLYGELYVPLVIAPGKIFKRDLFKDKLFPVNKIHEDEFLSYKLLFDSKVVCFSNRQMYYYWQRPNSIMFSLSIQSYQNVIEAYEEQAVFYDKNGLFNLKNKSLSRAFGVYNFLYMNKEKFSNHSQYLMQKKDYKSFLQRVVFARDLSFIKRLKYFLFLLSPYLSGKLMSFLKRIIQ